MQLARYFHTLRHLRPIQISGRLWHRMNPAKPDLSAAPSLRQPSEAWSISAERPASMLAADTFRCLNHVGQVRHAVDWNDPAQEKLWLYNLHYFDDLNAVAAADRGGWQRALLARWVAENPPGFGNGWEPYPTSLRIVNWIKWSLAGNTLEPGWVQSLAVQARWLRRHIEWHLLGNHLFVNAKALVFAGLFFAGDEADEWLAQGLEILGREVPEQVLPDGGHFELSPMYHAIILEDLLDLLNAAGAWPGQVPETVVSQWRVVVGRMLHWLEGMIHPDGDIAFFNDAALGIAPGFASLAGYARRLGVEVAGMEATSSKLEFGAVHRRATSGDIPFNSTFSKTFLPLTGVATESARGSDLPLSQRGNEGDLAAFACAAVSEIPPSPPLIKGGTTAPITSSVNGKRAFAKGGVSARCTHFADSGYVRLEQGDMVALLDVARIGPDYLPGHAHADTLSFELSLFGQRVLVNSGTSQYGLGAERLRQRGTAAHSTVEIDGADSSEVWGGFRVARRARPFGLAIHDRLAVSPPLKKALLSLTGDAVGVVVPPFIKGGAGGISEAAAQANVAKFPPAPLFQRGERGALNVLSPAALENDDDVLTVTCAHDGYRRLPGKPVHRRSWRLSEHGLQVKDVIEGDFRAAVARYHLHPSVKVTAHELAGELLLPDGHIARWCVTGGLVRVVSSSWHPEFGLTLPSSCIEIQFDGAEAVIDFSWE